MNGNESASAFAKLSVNGEEWCKSFHPNMIRIRCQVPSGTVYFVQNASYAAC